jgi:hypothetical protein
MGRRRCCKPLRSIESLLDDQEGDRQSVYQKEEKFFFRYIYICTVLRIFGGMASVTFIRSFVTWAHLVFPLFGG